MEEEIFRRRPEVGDLTRVRRRRWRWRVGDIRTRLGEEAVGILNGRSDVWSLEGGRRGDQNR